MFRAFFQPIFRGSCTPLAVVQVCRSCTAASEDGIKETPKHVRQKEIDKKNLKNLAYMYRTPNIFQHQ
jgi:hypothetical protein